MAKTFFCHIEGCSKRWNSLLSPFLWVPEPLTIDLTHILQQFLYNQDREVQGGFCLSHSRPTGSQGVKVLAYKVPGSQGVSLQGPKGSRGRPTGFLGGQGVGLEGPQGSRGRLTGSQGVGFMNRCPKSSNNWEKLRCHACDGHTYTHVESRAVFCLRIS